MCNARCLCHTYLLYIWKPPFKNPVYIPVINFIMSFLAFNNLFRHMLPHLGTTTAPADFNVYVRSFTALSINVTVPIYGSECVDEYRATLQTSNQSVRVVNVNQRVYTFDFFVNICRDVLIHSFVEAVGITDDFEGATATIDLLSTFNRVTLLSQKFTSTGLRIVLFWEVSIYCYALN